MLLLNERIVVPRRVLDTCVVTDMPINRDTRACSAHPVTCDKKLTKSTVKRKVAQLYVRQVKVMGKFFG